MCFYALFVCQRIKSTMIHNKMTTTSAPATERTEEKKRTYEELFGISYVCTVYTSMCGRY